MDFALARAECSRIHQLGWRGRTVAPSAIYFFAAFTFDDGFADNLTRALPVMEPFSAPFTVFVSTGMITRAIDAWWFGLAELVNSRNHIELQDLGPFECPDRASKKRVFNIIESAIHRDFRLLPQLQAVIKASKIETSDLVHREALTKEQLRLLACHPLVTIGGHTTTHRNLSEAAEFDVRAEMVTNRKYLEDLTNRSVMHFAYPFGHAAACGEREAQIARSVGFRSAVTTRHGTVFSEHLKHLHALPRVPLSERETTASLRCKVDGFYRACHSWLGDPIARM